MRKKQRDFIIHIFREKVKASVDEFVLENNRQTLTVSQSVSHRNATISSKSTS